VECRSFTAAAKRLNISAARVSKSIEHLEKTLGTVLFHRNTRQMNITDSGEHCYNQAVIMINQWQSLKETLLDSHSSAKGHLRISAPMTWGKLVLAPLIESFMGAFPNISLDIQLNDQHVNVLEDQFDLVLRLTRQLPDSSLSCRKITDYRMVACASPAYLATHGEPRTPNELKEHQCLMYSLPGAARKWDFFEGNKPIEVYLDPWLLSNNSELLHSALLAGRGIALIPDFIVSKNLTENSVVPILKNYRTTTLNLYSLRPENRMPSHRLTVFLDYLYERLGKIYSLSKD